jgi:hypothetical protein
MSRSIVAKGSSTLLYCVLTIFSWWVFASPHPPSPGYAWDLRPSQPTGPSLNEIIFGVLRDAVTLSVAFSVFLFIGGNCERRRFTIGILLGLPVVFVGDTVWTLYDASNSPPIALETTRLLPGLLGLAVSIWIARPLIPSAHAANAIHFVRTPVNAIEQRAEVSRASWIPMTAGLLVAGSVAWLARPAPLAHSLLWSCLWVAAARYVLIACLGGIVAHWLGNATATHRTALSLRSFPLPEVVAMAWMAPATLFLTQRSVWASFCVFVLSLSASRAIYSGRIDTASDYHKRLGPRSRVAGIFAAPAPQPLARQSFPAISVGLCLDAVIVACLANRSIVAAVLSVISASLIGWLWATMSVRDEKGVRSLFGSFLWFGLYVVTAIALTAGGLTRYLTVGNAVAARSGQSPRGTERSMSYRGVILFEEKHRKGVVVPPVQRRNPLGQTQSKPQPLSIPFDGVYWFFQPPEREPANGSLRQRGSPEKLSFRSTDERALIMEARQNFGRLIDINCCSEIQITVTNGEPYPRSVALELSLANTTLTGSPSWSLGTAKVTPQPVSWLQRASERVEILTYKIPALPEIRQFDEAVIIFNRSEHTASRSARIAINQFVFLPRR